MGVINCCPSVSNMTDAEMDFISTTANPDFAALEAGEPSTNRNAPTNNATSSKGNGFFADSRFSWLFNQEEEPEEEEEKPLLEELDIDLKDIFYKIRCVLLPFRIDREILLSSPDFWGPMLVICAYSMLLVWGQFRVISWVFTVWLCGSFIIFVLTRALGAEITFSQTVGIVGYSLLPQVLTALLLVFTGFSLSSLIIGIIKAVGILWSSLSAGSLLASADIERKRFLSPHKSVLESSNNGTEKKSF